MIFRDHAWASWDLQPRCADALLGLDACQWRYIQQWYDVCCWFFAGSSPTGGPWVLDSAPAQPHSVITVMTTCKVSFRSGEVRRAQHKGLGAMQRLPPKHWKKAAQFRPCSYHPIEFPSGRLPQDLRKPHPDRHDTTPRTLTRTLRPHQSAKHPVGSTCTAAGWHTHRHATRHATGYPPPTLAPDHS